MTILCIEDPTDPKRCQLVAATAALGVATGACTAIPLVCSLMPYEFAKAASAPVEVDFSGLPWRAPKHVGTARPRSAAVSLPGRIATAHRWRWRAGRGKPSA